MTSPMYDDIREQIERGYRRLALFVFHLIIAITTIVAIWTIDPTPEDGALVLAFVWCGFIIFHAVNILMAAERDRAIVRQWAQYKQDNAVAEKPKRFMRLANESRLEVVDDEDDNFPLDGMDAVERYDNQAKS